MRLLLLLLLKLLLAIVWLTDSEDSAGKRGIQSEDLGTVKLRLAVVVRNVVKAGAGKRGFRVSSSSRRKVSAASLLWSGPTWFSIFASRMSRVRSLGSGTEKLRFLTL